jgi:hypothetical protein
MEHIFSYRFILVHSMLSCRRNRISPIHKIGNFIDCFYTQHPGICWAIGITIAAIGLIIAIIALVQKFGTKKDVPHKAGNPQKDNSQYVFQGRWKNIYSGAKENGEEIFEIINGDEYWAKGKKVAVIKNVNFSNDTLSFIKHRIEKNDDIQCRLNIISDVLLRGTEINNAQEFQVEYCKINASFKSFAIPKIVHKSPTGRKIS